MNSSEYKYTPGRRGLECVKRNKNVEVSRFRILQIIEKNEINCLHITFINNECELNISRILINCLKYSALRGACLSASKEIKCGVFSVPHLAIIKENKCNECLVLWIQANKNIIYVRTVYTNEAIIQIKIPNTKYKMIIISVYKNHY